MVVHTHTHNWIIWLSSNKVFHRQCGDFRFNSFIVFETFFGCRCHANDVKRWNQHTVVDCCAILNIYIAIAYIIRVWMTQWYRMNVHSCWLQMKSYMDIDKWLTKYIHEFCTVQALAKSVGDLMLQSPH